MKNLIYTILLIFITSCSPNQTDKMKVDKIENKSTTVSEQKKLEFIIGERIDGPANVRNKPNGEVLFELYDNALIELTTTPENGWYQVLVYADIDYKEFEMDSILKDRPIIVDNDTIGKVIKSHYTSTERGGDFTYAMLHGFTHKNNIKPETVIETVLKKNLSKNGRNYLDWIAFIKAFQLKEDAVGYKSFQSYYNYENSIEDPSPGFRIVLLFEKQRLVGLIHSRELQIDKSITHKLSWSYYITFFEDFPEKEQLKFVDYMNKWIQGVD